MAESRNGLAEGSRILQCTPEEFSQALPFSVFKAADFHAGEGFVLQSFRRSCRVVLYSLNGIGRVRQDSLEFLLKKNQAVMMDMSQPITISSFEHPWHVQWIMITGSGMKGLAPILQNNSKAAVCDLSESLWEESFSSIVDSMENRSTETILKASLAADQILTAMAVNQIHQLGENNREQMEATAAYIRTHYTENLDMDDLLKLSRMSQSYFVKMFRYVNGTTPYNYLLSCRISKAKELLEMTDEPIAQIASELGFRDVSAFSTRFAGMTGMSPLKYRKMQAMKRKSYD